jgi:hypothetical protein
MPISSRGDWLYRFYRAAGHAARAQYKGHRSHGQNVGADIDTAPEHRGEPDRPSAMHNPPNARCAMRAKTIKTTVVAIVASSAILGAGCGGSTATPKHAAPIGKPSVAQIQAYVNEQLNPHPHLASESASLYGINRSRTTCIDEGAGRFKCLTTNSNTLLNDELTNATCSQSLPLHCIRETTTNTEGESGESASATSKEEAPASANAEAGENEH